MLVHAFLLQVITRSIDISNTRCPIGHLTESISPSLDLYLSPTTTPSFYYYHHHLPSPSTTTPHTPSPPPSYHHRPQPPPPPLPPSSSLTSPPHLFASSLFFQCHPISLS